MNPDGESVCAYATSACRRARCPISLPASPIPSCSRFPYAPESARRAQYSYGFNTVTVNGFVATGDTIVVPSPLSHTALAGRLPGPDGAPQ